MMNEEWLSVENFFAFFAGIVLRLLRLKILDTPYTNAHTKH